MTHKRSVAGLCALLASLALLGCSLNPFGNNDSGSQEPERRANLILPTTIHTAPLLGNEILFSANLTGMLEDIAVRSKGIYAAGLNATVAYRLTDIHGVSPAFLADGRVIYWRTEGEPGYAIISAGNVTNLAITPTPTQGRAVGLRGDTSDLIAYTSGDGLYVVGVDGGVATRIAESAKYPCALSDGRIAYATTDDVIHAVAADGTGDIAVFTARGRVRGIQPAAANRIVVAVYNDENDTSTLYTTQVMENVTPSGVFAGYASFVANFSDELGGIQALTDGRFVYSYGVFSGIQRGVAMATLQYNVLGNLVGLNQAMGDTFTGLWVLDGGPV